MNVDPNSPAVPTRTQRPSDDPMAMIQASAQMHGNAVRPEDQSYWMGKWTETGQNPDYFWSLLMRPAGGAAAPAASADPLVYKTLPQVPGGLTPALPSYASVDATPGAAYDAPPPPSRVFGSAGAGASSLDPRALQRDALVKMLGRRG